MPTQMSKPQGRVISIDVFRGFFLFIMVLVHFVIAYSSEEATNSFLYFFFDDALADWGAASFLLMMGISQVLSAKRVGDVDNLLLFKRALLRGTYIFMVGLLMLACAWGFEELWVWDILTLMGVATIVLFFCRFLPSWLLLGVVIAVALVTPHLRGFFDLAANWGGGFEGMPFISYHVPGMFVTPLSEYASSWQFTEVMRGFFLAGFFPVMPWIIFPIIGLVLGRRLVHGKLRRDLPLLWIVGLLFICSAFIIAHLGKAKLPSSVVSDLISPMCFYPDSFSQIDTIPHILEYLYQGLSLLPRCQQYFYL